MMVALGFMFSPALVSPPPNPTVVRDHASVWHQSWCFIPLSTALMMKSVTVVMFATEEVRAHWCLAKDVVASNKFRPGTLKQEFKGSRGVSESIRERVK